MLYSRSDRGGYVLAWILGAAAGGLVVAVATRAVPAMMSRMMAGMMQNMMAGMKEGDCEPGAL
jgi:hypothetical protein